MIDWVNALLPYPHTERIHDGAVVLFNAEGEAVRTTMKKALKRGSFDNAVAVQSSTAKDHVRADGSWTHIWVSGSPKPLQGHNLFGTESPIELAAMLGRLALEKDGRTVDPFTFQRWLSGRDVKLTRVDITHMLDTGSETNAAAWMAAAKEQVSIKHRPNCKSDEGTIYFGKKSKRWALKLYQKFTELTCSNKKHRLPEEIEHRQALLDYAQGTVRAELVLHSMQLKKMGLQDGRTWAEKPVNSFDIWSEYMKKVELSGNVRLHPNVIEKLPRSLRGTYAMWSNGDNVKKILVTKNSAGVENRMTFYRHRKGLLAFGIDISKPKVQGNNVVPILRVIEARPKAIPEWAINTPLLARAA